MDKTTKICCHCGQSKPISEFYRSLKASDGLQSWCRKCLIDYSRLYRKNRHGGSAPVCGEHAAKPDSGDPGPATACQTGLGSFSDRELADELKRRGYEGELTMRKSLKV